MIGSATLNKEKEKQSFLYNQLPKQRILSVDTFRGITILVMIFVNEVAGVKDIPQWMKHMPADADAMTFVDVVFPAFLFIVGMSVPFAINTRLSKGDSFWQLQWHVVFRSLALLVLGVFMVNTEGGYHEEAMGMSIHLWALCFYASAILVWNVYIFRNKTWTYLCRGMGIACLLTLALIYRGGDGTEYIQPRWWGILGLIGWAYLYTCIIYQVCKGNQIRLILMVVFCTGVYMLSKSAIAQSSLVFGWAKSQAAHAAHTSIVLCGVITSLIFFNETHFKTISRRFVDVFIFATGLLIAGALLRPYYQISKIYATPTWCLYSAAICCIIFALLYWLIDLKKQNRWTTFFQPAAANPLLTYIIPPILAALFHYLDFFPAPAGVKTGFPGILWCLGYAIAIMWLVRVLNKLRIRLQL